MPTKRTPITREPVQINAAEWRWLTDEDEPDDPFERFMVAGRRDLWEEHRDRVLMLWGREWPGSRRP
jgi:hypothetical protein